MSSESMSTASRTVATGTRSSTSIASKTSKVAQTFSSGREFYDDGYTEEERNIADLPSSLKRKSDSDFFGRSEELQALRKVKKQVIIGDNQDKNAAEATLLPAVLVWGVSGTGKSHLIQQFLKETKQQSSCYILQGKHDEYTGSSDPFSALVQALNDLSTQLKDGPVEELTRMRKCIEEEFGGENNKGNGDGDDNSNRSDETRDYRDAVGSSALTALINVVPSLSVLLDHSLDSGSVAVSSMDRSSMLESASMTSQNSLIPPTPNQGFNESAWNSLQYVFLQFVKAISTKERPVYLFLDDLQWSSPVALELLANLVSDPELKNFLFLGSIRQETNIHNDEVLEVATTSPLSACFLCRLQSQSKELTHVTTQNLSIDDTKYFLSSLLGDYPIDDDLHDLARKIHSKTQGNIFFTMQALEELKRNNILRFCRISFQWEWNFASGTAADEFSLSDNIVSVIESKLRQLPQDLQDVLSLAAYVRATFDASTLLHVIQNEQRSNGASPLFMTRNETIDEEYLFRLLEKAILENLFSNPIGGTNYRFAHDRIQQAAYSMIPHGEVRNMMRVRIGNCLLGLYRKHNENDQAIPTNVVESAAAILKEQPAHHKSSSTEDYRGLLFVAVDHLNSVSTKDHMFLAKLNLEVGEQAIQMAAMASAAAYLDRAARELKRIRNPWEEHYDISLRLHRARSDVQLALGNFQRGYSLGEEVLSRAKTIDEKLPTYLSIATGLGRQDKFLESLEVCLTATTTMGEFPKRWYLGHIAQDMMKIKSFLKKNDDAAILQLPLMTDERKLMTMKLLSELIGRAHMSRQMIIWLVTICRQLRNTIRFGLCADSAFAFSVYGLLSGASGDQDMAMRCAGLAQRIITKTNGKSMAGMVSFVAAAFIVTFRSPIADVIQEHRRGYKSSMETGELELGFMHWQMSTMLAYLAGYELQPLAHTNALILQQCKLYRVEALRGTAAGNLSIVETLIGKKPIDWDAIQESASRDITREQVDPSELLTLSSQFQSRMMLAAYFRRYDLAKKLANNYLHVSSGEKTCFSIVSRGICPGIIAAERYRETGKRKHLRMLNKILADLRKVAKTRGSRFIHHVLMLKAELLSVQKHNSASVKEAYDTAILVALKSSFIQDAAWTCELAGEYCIHAGCSKDETSAYFVKAVECYGTWGCVIKVDDIKQRRSEYLAGLNENLKKTKAQSGGLQVITFESNPGSSQRVEVDVMSSYTPTMPTIGSSIADSRAKTIYGLQEPRADEANDDEDCNLSVLTDGST